MNVILNRSAILVLLLACIGRFSFGLGAGDVAPDFAMKNQDGKIVKLSSFRGKPVLVYFYPHDNTPGCTTEAQTLRDSFEKYQAQGAVILGVSRQDEKSHRDFKAKNNLPFDLLVDADGEVGKKYGIGTMPLFGTFHRESVLIGPDQKVVHFYFNVDPEKHAAEVLRDIASAKMQSK
jgi:peroxiredoxin Q/BCP